MNITVFGAGAWGTALALSAAPRHAVHLWARDAQQAAEMAQQRVNTRYLPGVAWPPTLTVGADFDQAVHWAAGGLAVVAVPMSGLRAVLQQLPAELPVLWLCKGFEQSTGLLGHQVAAQARPGGLAGPLSGPSFAQEVARGCPTALVAASTDTRLTEMAVQALHSATLRIYTSTDPVGVEVGGAVKNVLAIATGIADGLALGLNARAALITRGLSEMSQLGLALGARTETFTGLAGLGDLVLTATGDLSRNRTVGLQLARGRSLPAILAELGHVAEGVLCADTVVDLARRHAVEMPLCEAVNAVLRGRLSAPEAAARLMHRQARAEF
jgi:glycerol-3-phosphate dehydrogenase (NAD(P)+)